MRRPPPRLRLQRLRDEALQEGLQVGEHARDVGGAASRVILLHHRVIGRKLQHIGAPCGLLAGKRHDVLEGGQEVVPVILRAKLPPQLLAAHPRIHLPRHEVRREAGAVDVAALEFRHGRLLRRVEVFRFRLGDPLRHMRGRRHLMRHGGDDAHGLRALLAAAVRHVHGLVHAQHGLGMVEGFEPAAEMVEFGEGHGGSFSKARGEPQIYGGAQPPTSLLSAWPFPCSQRSA